MQEVLKIAFFHINKQFMYDNLTKFSIGIKNPRYIDTSHDAYKDDPYLWANECINKKPSFAMEILRNSKGKIINHLLIGIYLLT